MQKILQSISQLQDKARQDALVQLLLLTPLRELVKMPISIDLANHPFFQEILKREKAQITAEVTLHTEYNFLKKMLISRFQTLPDWVEIKLQQANTKELEAWFDKVANTLEEIFEL